MKNTSSIKSEKVFQKTINKGNWYGGNFLSLYVLENKLDANYLGLAISKKVGKAHKRNHVKRLIKESYTQLESKLLSGYNFVFMWKSKASYDDVSYEGIYNDVKKMLAKANVYKKDV